MDIFWGKSYIQDEKKNQADMHLGRKDWSSTRERNPPKHPAHSRYFLCTKKHQWSDFLRVLKGKEKTVTEDSIL